MRASLLAIATNDFVVRRSLHQPMNSLPESSAIVLDAKQHRTSTVDQHAPQIDVAALADAQLLLFTPGRVLPWHAANPGGKVAPSPKGSAVSNGGHGCSRDQWAKARDLAQTPAESILLTDALNLIGDRLDVALQLLPLLPQALQQPAQTQAQHLQ